MMSRSLFAINPETRPQEAFEGVHDSTQRWGQDWVTPRFTRDEIERIIDWVDESGEQVERLYWEGPVLIHDPCIELTGEADIDEPAWRPVALHPDTEGRYALGAYSWTWHEVSAPAHQRPPRVAAVVTVAWPEAVAGILDQGRCPTPPAIVGAHDQPPNLHTPGVVSRSRTGPQAGDISCSAATGERIDGQVTAAPSAPGRVASVGWVFDHLAYRCGGREIIVRAARTPRSGYDLLEGGQVLTTTAALPQIPSPAQVTRFLRPRHQHLNRLVAAMALTSGAANKDLRAVLSGSRDCPRYAAITAGGTGTPISLHNDVDQARTALAVLGSRTPGTAVPAIPDLDTGEVLPVRTSAPPVGVAVQNPTPATAGAKTSDFAPLSPPPGAGTDLPGLLAAASVTRTPPAADPAPEGSPTTRARRGNRRRRHNRAVNQD